MRGHFFRECPSLDAGTKALLTKAFLKRCEERRQKEEELRQGQPVAAVRHHYGTPWAEAEQDEEDKSSSGTAL